MPDHIDSGEMSNRDAIPDEDEDSVPLRRSIEVEYWVIDDGRLTDPGDLTDASEGVEREFVEPLLEIKTTPCESTAGLRTVDHDGTNRLLEGIDETMTVFLSHADHVTEEPPGATVFASNEYGIQTFQKENVFAVQFHPEYDMETAKLITRGKSDQLPAERIEAVLEGIHGGNYAEAQHAKALFDNLLEFVRETQRERIDAAKSR